MKWSLALPLCVAAAALLLLASTAVAAEADLTQANAAAPQMTYQVIVAPAAPEWVTPPKSPSDAAAAPTPTTPTTAEPTLAAAPAVVNTTSTAHPTVAPPVAATTTPPNATDAHTNATGVPADNAVMSACSQRHLRAGKGARGRACGGSEADVDCWLVSSSLSLFSVPDAATTTSHSHPVTRAIWSVARSETAQPTSCVNLLLLNVDLLAAPLSVGRFLVIVTVLPCLCLCGIVVSRQKNSCTKPFARGRAAESGWHRGG